MPSLFLLASIFKPVQEDEPFAVFLFDVDVAVHERQQIIVSQASLDPRIERRLEQALLALLFDFELSVSHLDDLGDPLVKVHSSKLSITLCQKLLQHGFQTLLLGCLRSPDVEDLLDKASIMTSLSGIATALAEPLLPLVQGGAQCKVVRDSFRFLANKTMLELFVSPDEKEAGTYRLLSVRLCVCFSVAYLLCKLSPSKEMGYFDAFVTTKDDGRFALVQADSQCSVAMLPVGKGAFQYACCANSFEKSGT